MSKPLSNGTSAQNATPPSKDASSHSVGEVVTEPTVEFVTISDDEGNNDAPIDDDTEEDDDEFDDTESLLMDILNGELDETLDIEDAVPTREAVELRSRLREIGPNAFILETISSGRYTAKRLLTAFDIRPPEVFGGRPDQGYYRLLGLALLRDLSTRHKLPQYNTVDDAVKLLKTCQNIMVITGAGISTNLGVPDFRSKETGFYDQMREKGFDSPEDIFDIETFREDPSTFYSYSSPTLPEPTKSTPTHAFIKLLESKGKLLTNYTQNIDNVEGNVGIGKDKLVQCHGSWASFTCTKCGYQADGKQFYDDVKAKRVVYHRDCPSMLRPPAPKRKRSSNSRSRSRYDDNGDEDEYDSAAFDLPQPGVMKPNITFFGEKLPDNFFDRFKKHDRDIVDLIVVIGTSMSVSPVSEIPMAVPPDVPQIVISRERIKHVDFDVTMLGDCDLITEELAKRADWDLHHPMLKKKRVELVEENHASAIWRVHEMPNETPSPERVT